MSIEDIIRAWKDEDFRDNLDKNSRDLVPKNPAGPIELPENELRKVAGANGEEPNATGVICAISLMCVTELTSCYPTCTATLIGTCPWFTAGCC